MALGFLRLQEYSLHYFLKKHLAFSTTNEILATNDNKSYKAKHGDWIVDSHVFVFRNGKIVPSGEYVANYRDGIVSFKTAQDPDVKITASYFYNWIEVTPSFPDELSNKPIISLEMGPSREGALQLGGGRWVYTMYHLNVFALNRAQRDDMAQMIRETLEDYEAPLVDYNLGFPMLSDGARNPSYSEISQKICNMFFNDVRVNPNPTQTGDDVERNRTLINFVAVSIRAQNKHRSDI